jgi:chemotaxis protein MotB
MARKKKHEEHANHEAWAIPYGDLVTLLFALFTVMYAMSSVNEGKYRVLSDSLVAAFRGTPKTTTPITVEKSTSGKGGDRQLSGMRPTALMKLRDPKPQPPPLPQIAKQGGLIGEKGASESVDGTLNGSHGDREDPGKALFQMADEVKAALQGLIDKNLVHVRQTANSLEVEIKTDILFPSGVAKVQATALPVLNTVAKILKPFPNAVRVEGHTDNRPIATATFPSNWELSAARAANVVELFAKAGVDPLRMQVLGLGEFRPSAANDSAEGRNTNRRVVIVVLQQPPVDGKADPVGAALAGVTATPAGPVGPTVLIQKPDPAQKTIQGKKST